MLYYPMLVVIIVVVAVVFLCVWRWSIAIRRRRARAQLQAELAEQRASHPQNGYTQNGFVGDTQYTYYYTGNHQGYTPGTNPNGQQVVHARVLATQEEAGGSAALLAHFFPTARAVQYPDGGTHGSVFAEAGADETTAPLESAEEVYGHAVYVSQPSDAVVAAIPMHADLHVQEIESDSQDGDDCAKAKANTKCTE